MTENRPGGKSSILAHLVDMSKPGRWWSDEALAEHDREVAARTLREAADYAEQHSFDGLISPDQLRGRANAAEREPDDVVPGGES